MDITYLPYDKNILELLPILLVSGLDPNLVTRHIFNLALAHRNYNTVKLYLDNNPDAYIGEIYKKSGLLREAIKRRRDEDVKFFITIGVKIDENTIFDVVKINYTNIALFLIRSKLFNLNYKYDYKDKDNHNNAYKNNSTLLHIATQNGNMSIVKELIKQDAKDTRGLTSLDYAVEQKSIGVIKLLT